MDAPFLHHLADLAARETLPRFRSGGAVANKLDAGFDPVTEGDREAERAMRAAIERDYPAHSIIGEEFGTKDGDEWTWILDPIDGTRAFVSGLPVWGTLIGLYRDGRPHMGLLSQPFTGERYWSDGHVSWFRRDGGDDAQLATSGVSDPADATIMTTDPGLFRGVDAEAWTRVDVAVRMRRYGCDCYAYAMVAAGHVEAVVESGLNIYDIAALIPIIEGAGGVVTDWQGDSAAQGGSVVASGNQSLHEKLLKLLDG